GIGWYLLAMQGTRSVHEQSERLLGRLDARLHATVNEQVAVMQRLGERWDALGALPPAAVAQAEASSYLRDFESLELVAVLDPAMQVAFQRRIQPAAERWLDAFRAAPASRTWFAHARESGQAHMSAVQQAAEPVPRNL